MSTSVLLAEIFLGAFVWRLTATVPIDIVAYMDDLNLISDTPEGLDSALTQLWHFSEVFQIGHLQGQDVLMGHG